MEAARIWQRRILLFCSGPERSNDPFKKGAVKPLPLWIGAKTTAAPRSGKSKMWTKNGDRLTRASTECGQRSDWDGLKKEKETPAKTRSSSFGAELSRASWRASQTTSVLA